MKAEQLVCPNCHESVRDVGVVKVETGPQFHAFYYHPDAQRFMFDDVTEQGKNATTLHSRATSSHELTTRSQSACAVGDSTARLQSATHVPEACHHRLLFMSRSGDCKDPPSDGQGSHAQATRVQGRQFYPGLSR